MDSCFVRRAQVADVVKQSFPGGSRKRVNRAGEQVRRGAPASEDLEVIETWRTAHRPVINSFNSLLRMLISRTGKTGIVVAQRHKRARTIIDKLKRFPKMQLSRMDDVAGCRLIFENIEELEEFRESIHKAKFNHKRKNDSDKYDYIENPKLSGYRGIHDVYEYNVRSAAGQAYKGLLIELQYRTFPQHAWATCVELVGFLAGNQPKFDRGDEQYRNILRLASEIIARSAENLKSSLPDLSNEEVVKQFLEFDNKLRFMHRLRALNAEEQSHSNYKNFILIFEEEGDTPLEILSFRYATDALKRLFELESEQSGRDIVLVRGDTAEDIREAFKNYFSDARNFVELIEKGCEELSVQFLWPEFK